MSKAVNDASLPDRPTAIFFWFTQQQMLLAAGIVEGEVNGDAVHAEMLGNRQSCRRLHAPPLPTPRGTIVQPPVPLRKEGRRREHAGHVDGDALLGDNGLEEGRIQGWADDAAVPLKGSWNPFVGKSQDFLPL